MFISMYVCMHVCTVVFVFECTYICMFICLFAFILVFINCNRIIDLSYLVFSIVRTYVCMYVWSVDAVAHLMPLFSFMFIQGEQLLSALENGDMATVRRLLEEDPNLVHYKDCVRKTEYVFMHVCMRVCSIRSNSPYCIYYSHVSVHPSIIIATSS